MCVHNEENGEEVVFHKMHQTIKKANLDYPALKIEHFLKYEP